MELYTQTSLAAVSKEERRGGKGREGKVRNVKTAFIILIF